MRDLLWLVLSEGKAKLLHKSKARLQKMICCGTYKDKNIYIMFLFCF